MRVLLVVVFASQAYGFDSVVEVLLETVNKSTDPCDNFYRHACPLGTPNDFLELSILKTAIKKDGIFNKLELLKDLKTEEFEFSEAAANIYRNLCNNGKDTTRFLSQLGKMFKMPMDHYSKDEDCERVSELIKTIFSRAEVERFLDKQIRQFNYTINIYADSALAISVHLDNNLESAIKDVKDAIETMKIMAEKFISETPWIGNNNVANFTLSTLELTHLPTRYANILRDSYDVLFKFELEYQKCKLEYEGIQETNSFCFVVSADAYELKNPSRSYYSLIFNAYNGFPELTFGFPFYFMMETVEEMAAKLGSVYFTVGHEVGHTLIKGKDDIVQTYFSQEAVDCIQDQFNSTCTMFKEKSCETTDSQIDENGADVFALQIAYTLLEEHYGARLKDVYEPLGVTYQQLFFYSIAPFFCTGDPIEIKYENGDITKPNTHASDNVRINVLANHPGFKDAFQCSDDSRMMKSATKYCKIYGEDAPLNKRR